MKRIGVVSRIHGVNYGANLQAVALQTALTKFGAYAEYINVEVNIPLKGLHNIKSKIYGTIRLFLGFRKRIENTFVFQNKYLNCSKPINNDEELDVLIRTYDVLLSGSDQIWNPRYLPLSKDFYLLPFHSEKPHYSYASSFGVNSISEKLQSKYYKYLKIFNTVSVREITGQQILSRIGISARVDIDPTLLLREDEWFNFFDKETIISGEYICCYVMNGATDLNNYLIKQAEILQKQISNNPKIVVLGDKEFRGWYSKHTYIPTAGPSEFLNILYNSHFVLTSSFHGTCFSIIFKKNFYSILDEKNKFNSRIVDLLKLLDLDDRVIYREQGHSIKSNVVNYSHSYAILDKLRASSLEYVKEIVCL